MANPLPLVALPSWDLSLTAVVGANTPDLEYPPSNLQDGDPANVAKSSTNSITFTFTTASASIVAAALINTNATSATVNGVAVTIPSLDLDGQRVHGWLDRRTNPIGPSTTWTVVLSRASGVVWIGAIALLTDLEELPLLYGLELGVRRPGDVIIRTRLQSLVKLPQQIRTRWAKGALSLEEIVPFMVQLEKSAQGPINSFVFIPDEAQNDAWYVSFDSDDFSVGYPDYGVRAMPFRVTELSGGPPNG